mmetsp:Transcript_22897/g.70115  ORF Transcript_22897/g.70115 Transcript_22897/m.70115 type:complete len:303 (+) Transcript_22897:502-1410(+)
MAHRLAASSAHLSSRTSVPWWPRASQLIGTGRGFDRAPRIYRPDATPSLCSDPGRGLSLCSGPCLNSSHLCATDGLCCSPDLGPSQRLGPCSNRPHVADASCRHRGAGGHRDPILVPYNRSTESQSCDYGSHRAPSVADPYSLVSHASSLASPSCACAHVAPYYRPCATHDRAVHRAAPYLRGGPAARARPHAARALPAHDRRRCRRAASAPRGLWRRHSGSISAWTRTRLHCTARTPSRPRAAEAPVDRNRSCRQAHVHLAPTRLRRPQHCHRQASPPCASSCSRGVRLTERSLRGCDGRR